MPSDTSRVWFLPEDTPYFYWLIPHSSSEGVLGLIAEDMQKGRQSLEQFHEAKRFETTIRSKVRRRLSTIAGYHIHRRIGNRDVYLVGDAAGHVKSSTVGGVVTGSSRRPFRGRPYFR